MKKGIRFVLSLALALAMVLTTIRISTASYAGTDEPSAWAEKLVNAAIKKGYVPNHLQSRYKSTITKLELAQLLLGYLEYLYGSFEFTENGEKHNLTRDTQWMYLEGLYEDTKDRSADILTSMKIMDAAGPYPQIAKYQSRIPSRYQLGTVKSKGKFEPNDPLSRSYAAYYYYEFFSKIGAFNYNDATQNYSILKKFSDIGDDVTSQYLLSLHDLGLYGGSGKFLNLEAPLTREQAIIILEKFDSSKYKQVIHQHLGIGEMFPHSFHYKKDSIEGVAHLYTDRFSNGLLLSIPGKKELVFANNRDLTYDNEGRKNWSFEVYMEPQDVFSDERGNIHVVYFFFEGFDRYMPDDTTPRVIIRTYSPEGAVLETKQLYVKDITGMKADEFFQSTTITKVEYDNGTYFMDVSVGNLKDPTSGFVPATLTVKGNKGTLKNICADTAFKSSHVQYAYSKKLGGYIHLMDNKYGEQRGLNLQGPNGKCYTILHDWHAPKSEMDPYYYGEDTNVSAAVLTATDKGVAVIGAAPRKIEKPQKNVRKKDLYMQIVTKLEQPNPTMFLGGETRVGITHAPTEKKETDYGVIWLTDVKDYEMVNDISVTPIEDKLLIAYTVDLYDENPDQLIPKEAPNGNYQFYMVVATDGTILKQATKMPKYIPYMYAPVYWNGKLYWSSSGAHRGGVRTNELNLELK